jgi:hypothetical protein
MTTPSSHTQGPFVAVGCLLKSTTRATSSNSSITVRVSLTRTSLVLDRSLTLEVGRFVSERWAGRIGTTGGVSIDPISAGAGGVSARSWANVMSISFYICNILTICSISLLLFAISKKRVLLIMHCICMKYTPYNNYLSQ